MGAKKNNISQIDKYLKGELNAKAMHQLERQAQNDPFLMDALEGFEKSGSDQQANLTELEARLAHRVAKKETRSILLWRVLPMAACLLLMLGGGYWFISRPTEKVQYADNVHVESKPKQTATETLPALKKTPEVIVHNETPKKALGAPVVAKVDTVKYTASTIRVKENSTVDELVKRMARLEVDSTGAMAKQRNVLTAVKLNGKTFSGGNVKDATKNLPEDVIEKIQVIDSYGEAQRLDKPAPVFGNSKAVVGLKPAAKPGYYGSVANERSASAETPGKVVISGMVLDAITKEPLTGATIGTLKGGGITQADINGKYTVTIDKGDVLTYDFVSYGSQSHKLAPGEATVNVNLATDSRQMADVVVRGYVKRDRNQATGSSYIITGKEVQDNPVGNVEQLLQGKVAGLNIQNNTGAPGVRGSVNIRGLGVTGSVTDPSEKPYAMTLKLIDEKGSAATNAIVSYGDWSGKVNDTGLFKTVSMGPVVIGVSLPGYVTQFVKFNKSDTALTVTLKRSKTTACNESVEFRKQFEQRISTAEKFVVGLYVGRAIPVTTEEFNAAIKFIARYTKVSIGTKNDARYNNVDAFMADKLKWLTWYEANKCKGLK